MSGKNKKQFGVWMDSQHATVVGRENIDSGNFVILGHEKTSGHESNSNENAANNSEQASTHKFFKNILSRMQNAEEVHVTGTGTIQEQFVHFMADTPQFKGVKSVDSTSQKMSDEALINFITEKFS